MNDNLWSKSVVNDLKRLLNKFTYNVIAAQLNIKYPGINMSGDSVRAKARRLGLKKEVSLVKKKELRNRDYFEKEHDDSKHSKGKVYFVTSAIAGCELNKDFYESIKVFLKDRQAKLIVLPMRGVKNKDEEFTEGVLKELVDAIYTNYTFNDNLEAFDIKLSPNQINPLVGLGRLAQKSSSLIVASPKQHLETIPVDKTGIPHLLQSTGCVTTSPLNSKNRIGILASEDHVFGGIVVEVQDSKIYHLRQIQFKDGCFYDLNKKYTEKGVEVATAEAMVLGDIHAGEEDPVAMKAWQEVIGLVKPNKLLLHDTMNSKSVSYHERHNLTIRANRPETSKTLQAELDTTCEFLLGFANNNKNSEVIVVASNHDNHLNMYLDSGEFVNDPVNYKLALKLAQYRCDGLNPIEEYVKDKVGVIKNVRFLKIDEDFRVKGVQLGAHGHIGLSGSKGNVETAEKSYREAIIGHSHQPKVIRGVWQVGTSTYLRLGYNLGASAWLSCSCLLFKNSGRQLIISIDGKWHD